MEGGGERREVGEQAGQEGQMGSYVRLPRIVLCHRGHGCPNVLLSMALLVAEIPSISFTNRSTAAPATRKHFHRSA